MKHQSVASLLRSVAVAAFLLLTSISYSQVLTPRPTSISGTCGGYYEYLPQGYSTNTWQSYPLIVAVHGIGEIGNGTTDLGNLLNCWTAIPRLIANGGFPTSFNVGGQNYSFIVIAPQFNQWPYASDVNAVVDYAVSHYRVDQSRIYVTGLSMGGGSVWDFAGNYPTKAAAVVPVCGAASSDPTRAQAIANAKLPVWATHNQDDPTVSVSNTTGWVSLIGQYGGNIQSTIFPVSGHDAWSQTYNPTFTQNGVNVYQWMLMHQKGTTSTSSTPPPTTTNQSPTANAGSGQTISLPTSTATLSGTGSDPDGTINFYQWNQASGPSTAVIASPYSANTAVSGLVQGTYVFTLKVTDNMGATGTSNVTITVNGSSSTLISSTTSTSRIEAENYSNMYGVQKEGTSDAGGGQDVGYIDYGDWMDYSVNVSTAGTYAINVRLASPNGGQLQFKDASGNVLATVSVPNTGGYQNWQTVSTNIALAAGTQTIRIYSTSNGWNINWWEIAGAGSSTSTSSALTTSTTSTSRIEAENYSNMYGVQKEGTTDAGGGQDVGYIDYGDWMDYSVNVSSSGTYAINVRLASPNGGQLQFKDANGNVLATVSVPNTGGYQNWQTVSANINLAAGTQTIRVYSTSNGWNINWWEIAGAGSSTSTSSALTTSTTSTSRIEAENYSNMYGVQKEGTTDAGGGQDVGYIDYGDWMDYSVNVSTAGTYAVNIRVASPNGGQLQFKNASGTVLATVTVPNTGGYQNWQTVSANIALAAGTQTIRIYSTSNGWNINWWEIAGAGSSTTTTSGGGTTHIEAENYANMNGVLKEGTTDAGGGQDVGYIDYGDWMDYNVNLSASGTYAVNLRVASPTGGQLQIKNSAGTVLATVNVPATGGWQSWQTVSANISLSAGAQTVRVYSTSNGWNFNWWEISGGSGTVSAASVGKAEVVSSTLSTAPALAIYPNPIIDRFQLQVNNDLTGSVQVQVYDMQGSLQKQFALSKADAGTSQFYLSIGKLPAATYIIKVTMNGWTDSKQVIKK